MPTTADANPRIEPLRQRIRQLDRQISVFERWLKTLRQERRDTVNAISVLAPEVDLLTADTLRCGDRLLTGGTIISICRIGADVREFGLDVGNDQILYRSLVDGANVYVHLPRPTADPFEAEEMAG